MKKLIVTAALAAMFAGTAHGAGHGGDFAKQIKARQGQMQIIAINLGILGGMAKGAVEYDAATAQNAAKSLHGASMIHIETLFPEGSGEIDGTRAKASIWSDAEGFAGKWTAYGDAARNAAKSAGDGVEALGPLLGALGGSCKSCHETYRLPKN